MRERNNGSKSKLSAWIPKQIHKRAKILAAARDIDLQDLVATALQLYLTDTNLDATASASGMSITDLNTNTENAMDESRYE